MRKIILDTDMGIDDALALMLTLKSEELSKHSSHRIDRSIDAVC